MEDGKGEGGGERGGCPGFAFEMVTLIRWNILRRSVGVRHVVSGTFRSCNTRSSSPPLGCITVNDGETCVCDTELCNDEVVPPPPTIDCYRCGDCHQPTNETCTGQVCLTVTTTSS